MRCNSCGHGCAAPSGARPYAGCGRCSIARRRRSSANRAGMGDSRPPEWGRVLPSEYPHSARYGRATGVATGRAKIAGETHPSAIGASQATARSPPYPDPKHITLHSQPVEGAIPNRWRANPVIIRPYGPTAPGSGQQPTANTPNNYNTNYLLRTSMQEHRR